MAGHRRLSPTDAPLRPAVGAEPGRTRGVAGRDPGCRVARSGGASRCTRRRAASSRLDGARVSTRRRRRVHRSRCEIGCSERSPAHARRGGAPRRPSGTSTCRPSANRVGARQPLDALADACADGRARRRRRSAARCCCSSRPGATGRMTRTRASSLRHAFNRWYPRVRPPAGRRDRGRDSSAEQLPPPAGRQLRRADPRARALHRPLTRLHSGLDRDGACIGSCSTPWRLEPKASI